ncbi:MAG: hypothetical protein ACFFDK_11405 [Promethearchaeota archaeon]
MPESKNESNKKPKLKNKYVRSVIKLGNSKAITFPQDWTISADLDEKSEVSLYPLDEKTIIIRAFDKEKSKTIFRIDANIWSINLVKQGVISAFKLNIDEIYIKYNDNNQEEEVNKLLIELRSEIIGIDFKNIPENSEFFVNFLLDTSKTALPEVLSDLSNVFTTVIKNIIEGNIRKDNQFILDEIDRKYSLGRRILITGLADYPISKGYKNFPIIRFLGDRVILLYIRDFINEALTLQFISNTVIKKYTELLTRIPQLLNEIIKNYDNINLDSISGFQEYLIRLREMLKDIKLNESNIEEQQVLNIIRYFLNSFNNFFDIGITRLIETEIGMN